MQLNSLGDPMWIEKGSRSLKLCFSNLSLYMNYLEILLAEDGNLMGLGQGTRTCIYNMVDL